MTVGYTENADVIRATANCVQYSQTINNIYFYKCIFTDTQTDHDVMSALATQIDDIYAEINSRLSTQFSYMDIHFFNITQNRPMGTLDWPSMTSGSYASSEALPNGVTGLVLADTGYNRSRPKKYFSGFCEVDCTGNVLSATVTSQLLSLITQLLEAVEVSTGNTLTPGTWSKKYNTFRALVSAVVSSYVAYQRRRKPGRGV